MISSNFAGYCQRFCDQRIQYIIHVYLLYESDLWCVAWWPTPPPLPVRHVEWLTVRAQWLTLWPVLGPSGSRWKFTTISVICDNLVTRNPLTFGRRMGRWSRSAAGKIYCSGENEGIDPRTTTTQYLTQPPTWHDHSPPVYAPESRNIGRTYIFDTRVTINNPFITAPPASVTICLYICIYTIL